MFSLLFYPLWVISAFLAIISVNVLYQKLPRKASEPPLVFHWLPFFGNAVAYGLDPYGFFVKCREKHGDVFTFVLFGRKIVTCLGVDGNDFVLNSRIQDANAEEIYRPLTTPVFGSDVVYDCPNSKLMEQKKFVKFGLTQKALESHVQLIEREVLDYIQADPSFSGKSGTIDVPKVMAEITIFTAARSLQGAEVRSKLTAEFAALYHELDLGFTPINFLFPWVHFPHNRRRDAAHAKMREVYMDIIKERRKGGGDLEEGTDMIANLMNCTYKNGRPVPDKEIAHMMITLLMAGQHSSSSASSWIMLHLASSPDIAEELYQEQIVNLSVDDVLPPLQYSDLDKLPLLQNVVKETLRVHSSIHSIMRKVKRPMEVPGSPYTITTDKVILASPIVTALSEEHFSDANTWNPHRWDNKAKEEAVTEETIDYGYGIVSKGTKSPYLPFGAGRHRCIGEKFVYVNLGVIVATLVRNFRLSTTDGKPGVPATDYTSLFSRPVQPAYIRWERRKA
ncbi:cytochrome P450, family 51 (sterol 14-demethylase) [Fusarium austroafricanum]|uniref:Cytochrome P450, family 51 (Sterol 14-demethylase) n=1 Tax=Fusarium austroafricanum TaxID=2364996 RepID=A0A8H4KR24_9HYPO|nr:cytochrome P450, family 51 (sterol 14-demethylase) [Fusarium austroafricanum]